MKAIRITGSTTISVGDIIEFKGKGPVYECLSRVIRLFERKWDRWGWHVAFVANVTDDGTVYICEALGPGVLVSELSGYSLPYRVWRWFPNELPQSQVDTFVEDVLGKPYDVAIYGWTALQYLVRHFFNRRIPRLLDDRYTCWELVWYFCREMGQPLQSIYDCPIITDLHKAMGILK